MTFERAENDMSDDKKDYVVIPDDFPGYDKRHFCIPSHYQPGILVQDTSVSLIVTFRAESPP